MTEMLVFNLKILVVKVDVKGILVTKHWEEEIINHRKEECVERRILMAHQVSKALGVSKTFNIPRNHH